MRIFSILHSHVVALVFMLLTLGAQLLHLPGRVGVAFFHFGELLRELFVFLAQLMDTRNGSLNSFV